MKFVFRCTVDQEPYIDSIGEFPKTKRQALKESISKWERVVAFLNLTENTIESPDGNTCALCRVYLVGGCDGCPVKNKTGKRNCNGTPFRKFEKAKTNAGQLKCAKEEVKFLESLK